ncbi:hypothetical protein M2165_000582 [Variovorax sp. TBS-050B]|uniref:HesA/MoeB/ThiF family protein n=1 Tax=Variovorax sp. TBS-050B TaxID=2940551 RepID=UPI002476BB9C|nr:ThiF family adenylyltransferase [Variovorax sp. TBS-050B]MDH6590693.1 hypothetical protein [Variovorax sp. TBS-050B]
MLDKERIPSYLLDDIQKPGTKLYISRSWKIREYSSRLWLYNESAGSVDFDISDATARMVSLIAKGNAVVGDATKISADSWLRILLYLWKNDILRIAEDGNIRVSTAPSRYIWFEEYLRRYASPSWSINQMLAALASSKVCVIGLGGLGATLGLSLAASGIGSIKLVDGDAIEESNLPRQILYSEQSIGRNKANVLRDVILSNNSATDVDVHPAFISSSEDAVAATKGCDLVALCADQPRFKIRNWVGKACLERKIPYVFMAGQWVGPLSVPGASPCYACVGRFHGSRISDVPGYLEMHSSEEIPPRASFGPRPLVLAGFISAAIMHFLAGIDRESLLSRRFKCDLQGRLEEEELVRYRNCPVCGSR